MNVKMLLCALGIGCTLLGAAEINAISNSGFEKLDAQGKIADWNTGLGKAESAEGGVNGGKMIRTTTTSGQPNNCKSGISQKITSLKPGKYVFSGYFKGDMHALWLVLIYQGTAKPEKFTLWLNRFDKSDVSGWNRFSKVIEVPAGTTGGLLVIEAFSAKLDGQVDFDDVKLVLQQD